MIISVMKRCFQTVMSLNTYLRKISKFRRALRILTSESSPSKIILISQHFPIDKCIDMNVHRFHPLDGPKLSQEIGSGSMRRYDTLRIRHSLEEFWFLSVNVCEFKNWCYIATPVAIIRGWPDSHQLVIKHVLETWGGGKINIVWTVEIKDK